MFTPKQVLRHPLCFVLLSLALAAPVSAQAPAESASPDAARCERLIQVTLANTKITAAQFVAAGNFSGPRAPFSGADLSSLYQTLPAFCRVEATVQPTADSDIKIEVWLPASEWNGRLQGVGNGGFAGLIDYPHLGTGILHGYAAAATDTGHAGSPIDAAWALAHPEKVTDFGHRGIHEMTRVAKAAVHAYYTADPKHSYFLGCSDGGREALMEAQRYPEDYDGILAGAPANYWTALLSSAVWNSQALTLDPASYIPAGKIPTIAAAVNAACDAKDGVRDGVLNDPRACRFNPSSMVCKAGASDSCLTPPQAAALQKLYEGPHDSHGHVIFPGYLPGAEAGNGGWSIWIVGPAPMKSLISFFGVNYFKYMVYDKPDWDYRTFDIAKDMPIAEQKTAEALNATDPNLSKFKSRGGKLILYHGWDDPAIPAVNTVNYYESVLKTMGHGSADAFTRLYMIPGMQHCSEGPGANAFGGDGTALLDDPQHNISLALEQWVEKGIAPSGLIATRYEGKEEARHAVMTRPLCSYPQSATYKGKGDTQDAANFVCK